MTLHIRRAETGDLDVLTILFDGYRQFYEQPADLALARRFIGDRLQNGDSVIFLAFRDGAALGFTQLYPTFSSVGATAIFVLNDLFVDPRERTCGIGSALLRHAAAFAASSGAKQLTLRTATTNTTAQSVYERLGWLRDTRFFTYSLGL